jgi:predicted TIM-barrel fold metal-dependent hydrolase
MYAPREVPYHRRVSTAVPKLVDLSGLPIVDGHCHPLLRDPEDLRVERFLDLFSEGRPATMRDHVVHTGYFRRALRALARDLGVPPTPEAVLEARRRLGADAGRALFAGAGITALLVDTGYPPAAMPLAEMRERLGCAVHEVFRIETCAERLLSRRLPYDEFVGGFRRALLDAAPGCVAFKTIVAYRSGLDVRAWSDAECRASYGRAVAAIPPGGAPRLTDKPLLDRLVETTLEVARETGRPLQVHTGFGDPDIDLIGANPLLLRPILEDPRWTSLRIVLLHMAYPYVREAAFMTAVWPQVSLDLSLAIPFLGPGSVSPLVEILALAPSSKLMYGSDVSALPELFALSAEWGRAVLGEALGWLRERGELDGEEAASVGRAILSENARALYALPPEP